MNHGDTEGTEIVKQNRMQIFLTSLTFVNARQFALCRYPPSGF
jgi:hypothetical protein